VIASHRNMYLSSWYWKMKQRKGAKKAIIALARKLLVIIYVYCYMFLWKILHINIPIIRLPAGFQAF